ncbi:MAG: adenylate kinase [Actinomycetaceae bacterium]|nr:adenylate kinase [Actinomycetaceae bacterium]
MSVRLVLVGPPGAGKGTQADILTQRYSIPAISTGAIFRSHTQAGDELGRLADSYTSRGEFVPDEVTNRMVAERLGQADAADGFLLDGYPRNVEQVRALDGILEGMGHALDFVLEVTADDEVVVGRLLGRAAQQGRKDDTEGVIRRRIALYHETTEPLIDAYRSRGILVSVDGIGEIEEVAGRIDEAIRGFLDSRA